MKTSSEGLAEIVGHEGVVLAPYLDSVGVWTIGVGHTANAGPPDPAEMERGTEISLRAAMELFRRDIKKYEDRVKRAVKVPVSQHEFDALVSFDYNTGGIFKARLTDKLNAGDRAGAAKAFDGWHKPPEIIPRRNAEKRLFRDGVYSNSGQATMYPVRPNGRPNFGRGRRIDALSAIQGENGEAGSPETPPETGGDDGGRRQGNAAVLAIVVGLLISGAVWVGSRFSRWTRRRRLIAVGIIAVAAAAAVLFLT